MVSVFGISAAIPMVYSSNVASAIIFLRSNADAEQKIAQNPIRIKLYKFWLYF